MTTLWLLLAGFLIGIRHATEADHLAALATLATRHRSAEGAGGAWRQGAAWGLGHSCTLILFGGVALGLGQAIPPAFEQLMELAVACMLLGLGIDVLRRIRRQGIHIHVHRHGDGQVHAHAHAHRPQATSPPPTPALRHLKFRPLAPVRGIRALHDHAHPPAWPRRALFVGMMHGLAGTAALLLLVVGRTPEPALGMVYILAFALGSMLGMVLLSLVIAIPLQRSAQTQLRWPWAMDAAVGGLSCGLALVIILRLCAANWPLA